MEQEVITFKQTFEDLNKKGNNSLFYFDDEKIIPLNNRIRLIFMDSLSMLSSKFSSLTFNVLNPGLSLEFPNEELIDNIKTNFEQDLTKSFVFIYRYDPYIPSNNAIKNFKKKFDSTTYFYPLEIKGSTQKIGEELGELISMLYFREKGYIVQKPLGTYGKEGDNKSGVDDVVAWKSPVIDELRKFGFVDKGCHIRELACLRWLGKISASNTELNYSTTNEIILIEVKSSKQRGISDSPSYGVNQLLRASKEKIAKKLFICFPFIDENDGEIFQVIKSKTEGNPAVGAILFDNKGVYLHDSETFPAVENMPDEIEKKYVRNLKRVLLGNFYFDEILTMIMELINTKNKSFPEVLVDFYNKIEEKPVSYILERIKCNF